MKKFDRIFKTIMEELEQSSTDERFNEVDDDLADLFTSPEYEWLLKKFQNVLETELEKVKKADERLADVRLSFDDTGIPPVGGEMVMSVDLLDPETIIVNAYSFMLPYPIEELKDEQKFNEAVSEYVNIASDSPENAGQHTIQHECAHILDLLENGSERENMHDEKFEAIRKALNEKTNLDK